MIFLHSFHLLYFSPTILPLHNENLPVWAAPRTWATFHCKKKKSRCIVRASFPWMVVLPWNMCGFPIANHEDKILGSLGNGLGVTFVLFHRPDFLDTTNKSRHGRNQWVTWNMVASPVRCKLAWCQMVAHVSANNHSFSESVFTCWYTLVYSLFLNMNSNLVALYILLIISFVIHFLSKAST